MSLYPKLLFSIANCGNFNTLNVSPNPKHDCNTIVNFQRTLGIHSPNEFQLPEPWSGHIQLTNLLFIGTNPSMYINDLVPDATWPAKMVGDFFQNRFKNRGEFSWVNNHRVLKKDGTYGRPVNYFRSIHEQATTLFNTSVVFPGISYTITDIVHCKSQKSIGFNQALPTCARLYLSGRVGVAIHAKVIVLVGTTAKRGFYSTFGNNPILYNKAGKRIKIIEIPHPSSFIWPKELKALYNTKELEEISKYLNEKDDDNISFPHHMTSDVGLATDDEVKSFIKQKVQEYNQQMFDY